MPEDNKIKRRLTYALLAIFFLASVSITVYGLFSPIDLTGLSGRIESIVAARTGHRVLFDGIVVKLLPEPDITLKGLRVFEGGKPLITVKKLHLRLYGLPFLGGKMIIEKIEATGPEIFIKRGVSGAFNLNGLFKELTERGGKSGVSIKSIDLRDGAITITDDVPPEPVSYMVSGIEARLSESKNGFVYGAKGTLLPSSAIVLSGEGTKAGITGAGSIKDFGLERLNPYMSNSGVKFLRGAVEFNMAYSLGESQSFKGVARYRDLIVSAAALAKPVRSEKGTAVVVMRRADGREDLDITEARFMVNGFMVSMDLNVAGIGSSPYFTLNASTAEAPFKACNDLVPVNALNRRTVDVINGITPLGGTLTVRRLSAQGPLEALKKGRIFEKPVDIYADVGIDRLRYRYRGLSKTFSDLTGRLTLKNGVLAFKGSGAYGNATIDDMAWEMRDIPDRLTFSLKLSSSGDASVILQDIKEFTRKSLLDKVRASGSADVKFTLAGELATPSAKRFSIDTMIRDGTFSYAGLPLLRSLNGRVSFDNDRVTLRELSATDGRTTILAGGQIKDWLGVSPYFDLAGEGRLAKESLAPFIKNAVFDNLAVTGAVTFKGTVKGTKEKFSSSIAVNTAGSGIEYGNFVRKAPAYPLLAEGSFELSGGELFIKRLTASFGQSSINLEGMVSLDKRLFNIRGWSKVVRITDIGNVSPYLASDSAGGLVTFDMRLTGSANESSYEGGARIKDGRFKTPLIARRVERINASARFTGNSAVITIENISVGGSEITGTVNIPDVAGRIVIFDIFSPRLYAEDFVDFREGEKAPAIPEAAHPLPRRQGAEKTIIGMGRVSIRGGGAWGHAFHDFSTDVRIADNAVHLRPIEVTIDRGLIKGEATYYAGGSGQLFETDLTIAGVDLGRMISTFGTDENFLSGSLNGRLSISAKRGAIPFASGLNGEVSLRSEKGKLWQFLFFTKIFSVVNVFSINELFRTGLPYKFISGDFSVRDGIISTDNLIFNSHSMRMSAVGKLSLPDRSLDGAIAVKPFVTIDYILSQIPLAGWIIQGKEKSTVSMYFEVKGPVKDPEVTPLTVTGVGKGILGILQRLIEAPIKILKPDLE